MVALIGAAFAFATLRRAKSLDPRIRISLVVLAFAGCIVLFGNAVLPTPPKSLRDLGVHNSLTACAQQLRTGGFSRATRENAISLLTDIINSHGRQLSQSQYDALTKTRKELSQSFDPMPEQELARHIYDIRQMLEKAAETFGNDSDQTAHR